MREVLFKGKVEETGEWVEGFYIKQRDSLLEGVVHHYITVHEKNKRGLLNPMLTWYIVIPETVGQYTGLTDKNGEKIFEGDIVEGLDYDEEDGYGVVTWDDGAFWVGNNHYSGTFCDNYYGSDFEIIGNIHDNFEFIKGGASDGEIYRL